MALKEILGQLRPEPEREPLPPRRHYEPPSKGDITDDGSLSMTTISEDNFPEPRRTLDKREALRHLIHTAIRLIAEMGDPFAVHLLVHSADKILIDLAKQKATSFVSIASCTSKTSTTTSFSSGTGKRTITLSTRIETLRRIFPCATLR